MSGGTSAEGSARGSRSPTAISIGLRDDVGRLRAVRRRIRARIPEGRARSPGEHAGCRREAHPGRQRPSGAGQRVRVRSVAARSGRERVRTINANIERPNVGGRQLKELSRPDGEAEAVRPGLRRGVGVGDDVGAEERPAAVADGRRAGEDPLVGQESHPVGAALDARVVRRHAAGYAKGKPMLACLSGRKLDPVRRAGALSLKVDGKIAAASGKRKGEGGRDGGTGWLHRAGPVDRIVGAAGTMLSGPGAPGPESDVQTEWQTAPSRPSDQPAAPRSRPRRASSAGA